MNLNNPRKIKAVALLSGGLDSAIAAKIIIDQGIEVHAINFYSPFCICNSKIQSFECSAQLFASQLGIPIHMIEKGDDYLDLVKSPQYGYGKHMNPCIDCRLYTLKHAKLYADQIGAKFLITGEVLGQRPKSQTLKALQIIDHASGLVGMILRPLSAKLLAETIPEKEHWVDRTKLLGIQGRRRNIQLEIGRKLQLVRNYCAGGGCLLTDGHFAQKLKDYLLFTPKPTMKDMKFLKIGHHFRKDRIKYIVGRNEQENHLITIWARPTDILIEVKSAIGPTVLIEGSESPPDLQFGGFLAIFYSKHAQFPALCSVKDPMNRFSEFTLEHEHDSIMDPTPYQIN